MMRAYLFGVPGLAAAAILAATVSAMTGCDASDGSGAASATSTETIRSANVALSITGADGHHSEGSGILIAPRLVLTAAHLVAGQQKWSITTADGKTANGLRGLTYDWLVYNSDKSHPRKNDVAVIFLDKPIERAAYPMVTSGTFEMGKVTRVHGSGTSFTNVDGVAAQPQFFPHAYTVDMPNSETLDTGGAVLDAENRIVGVVSGRGVTSKQLYIARVDGLTGWISSQTNNCDSGSTTTHSSGGPAPADDGLHVHTYAPPPESTSSSSCSSGSTTNGSSGTTSSGSTSGSTSSGSTSSGSTSNGSSGTTSSGSTGGPPGCTGESNGNCYGDSCPSDTGTTSSSSTTSSSGTTGTPASGTHGSDANGCGGSNDNPESCPADAPTCTGPTCGGGSPDDQIDYGDCCAAPSGDISVK